MRFSGLCTMALAGVAAAMPQDQYGAPPAPDMTSLSKVTMTRTVLRVVETVTATRNGTVSTITSTSSETIMGTGYPSVTGIPSYNNATSTVLGHGALPTSTPSPAPTNAAGTFGIEFLTLAAVAGLAGLALF